MARQLGKEIVWVGVRRGPSLIELLRLQPEYGVGAWVSRKTWRPGLEWQVHAVRPQKDGLHGRVWGVLHVDGQRASDVQELQAPNKRGVWRVRSASADSVENIGYFERLT